jgi:hypothetical protein
MNKPSVVKSLICFKGFSLGFYQGLRKVAVMKAYRFGRTDIFIEPINVQVDSGEKESPSTSGDENGMLVQPSGLGTSLVKDSQMEITEVIATLAKEFDQKLQSLIESSKVKEVSLEFGLSITAETSIWLIKSSGEGSIKATLKWER